MREICYICSPKLEITKLKSQIPIRGFKLEFGICFSEFLPGCGEIGRHVRLRI